MKKTIIDIILILALCIMAVILFDTQDKLALETAALVEAVEQIDRRDRLLNIFMGGQWEPNCKYLRTPEELLADGSVLWHLEKAECED